MMRRIGSATATFQQSTRRTMAFANSSATQPKNSSGRYTPLHKENVLPAKELWRTSQNDYKKLPKEADGMMGVTGDAFGSMMNRKANWEPVERKKLAGQLGELMPVNDIYPEDNVNPVMLHGLCGRYGVDLPLAYKLFLDNGLDINKVLFELETKHGHRICPNSYGIVALEKYSPECYCAVRFSCPSFEATRSEDVLDAIHEITLSAAELPQDDSPGQLVNHLIHHGWDMEDGTPVVEVLKDYDLTVVDCHLLPMGDYSCTGFHVMNPLEEEGFPNIGTSVSATALDLRTGIHSRFRFELERLCDTLSEHINYESAHFGQQVHLLRQPFWWNPEYGVEELIRFKENIQKPSANIFEMRYSYMPHHHLGMECYRNVIELDKLRVAQQKYGKDTDDFMDKSASRFNQGQLKTMSGASGQGFGGDTNVANDSKAFNAVHRRMFADINSQQLDRQVNKFYQNHYH